MGKSFKWRYFIGLCLFFISGEAQAQQLLGLVLDHEDAPLPQVQIFDKTGRKYGESGNDGYFRLELKPGAYDFVFNHPDFESYQLAYIAKKNQNDTLSVSLLRSTGPIEQVEIKTKWTDPGPNMMRKAIARRNIWAARIPNQRAVVYIKAFEEIKNPRVIRSIDADIKPQNSPKQINANMAEVRLVRDWQAPNKIKESRQGVSIRGDKSSLFYLSTLEGLQYLSKFDEPSGSVSPAHRFSPLQQCHFSLPIPIY